MSRCKLCSTAARVPAPSLYRDRVGVSTYEFGGHKHLVCNKCGFYLSHSSYSWSEYPVLTQLSALAPPAILWAPCFCFQLQSDWRIQFMNNKLSNLQNIWFLKDILLQEPSLLSINCTMFWNNIIFFIKINFLLYFPFNYHHVTGNEVRQSENSWVGEYTNKLSNCLSASEAKLLNMQIALLKEEWCLFQQSV